MAEPLHHSDSIVIARPPAEVYDLVSDVTRMGEWSPICKACWWDEGGGPSVGSLFTGRNELPDRTWEMQCEVVAADPGREFAWVVSLTGTRWGFTLEPADEGTKLSESWDFPAKSVAFFEERFGDGAEAQIKDRLELARTGITVTLDAIKQTAEA
jgi:uncharacterized membrane protein